MYLGHFAFGRSVTTHTKGANTCIAVRPQPVVIANFCGDYTFKFNGWQTAPGSATPFLERDADWLGQKADERATRVLAVVKCAGSQNILNIRHLLFRWNVRPDRATPDSP